MEGQRSKVTDLLYLYNCQLGLGLVTLIMSSVVNPDTNPEPNPKRACRKNGLNRFHVVFSSFLERSNDVMEFSTLTKRNTIPHFHPARRLKPSSRKFVHAAGKM